MGRRRKTATAAGPTLPETTYHPAWCECPHCGHRLQENCATTHRRNYVCYAIRRHECPECGRPFRSRMRTG